MKHVLFSLGLAVAVALPAACVSSSSPNPGNAASDGGACEAEGLSASCASLDGGGETTPDAAREAGDDAATDASRDAGPGVDATDAGVDATDAGVDATDAGVDDAGVFDAPVDAVLPPPLGGCAATSLLADCSFEAPVVSAGGTQAFTNGQSVGAWTVVGATGNLNTISTTFTQNGFTFEAEDGQQSMDLTGTSNTATGVSQTVATTIGTTYELAFWVGNVVNAAGIFGVTSTVDVQVDGTTVLTPTNSNGAGTSTLAWQEFSFTFTATAATTTIAFINGDPSNDTSNFIDNVTLIAESTHDP